MRFSQKELKRLKAAEHIVKKRAAHFGTNKKREVIRLLYEISKREGISPQEIISSIDDRNYHPIKAYLLKRRFPQGSSKGNINAYLPALEFRAGETAEIAPKKFTPKTIFIEKAVAGSSLAQRVKDAYPKASVRQISSLKEYQARHPFVPIKGYNKRRDNIFVVSQHQDFFKACPCTQGARGCGYHIFNMGFGCIFECTYCYLQGYSNVSGIVLPANMNQYFQAFDSYQKPGMRLGTGEFSDSLMLDHVTQYSLLLIEFFIKYPKVTFEFKTKSNNIENLLKTKHAGNIVVSWSVNPQKFIDENEFYSASLDDRIKAAQKCVRNGYKIGFHFDPIVYSENWEKEYEGVVEKLASGIAPEHIAWISLGTLRFARTLKPVIEARFPENKILDGELVLGYDGKLRYPAGVRLKIYQAMTKALQRWSKNLPVYLCMEEEKMI